MHKPLYTIDLEDLSALNHSIKNEAINALESGNIIYFPMYPFALKEGEQDLLSHTVLDPKHKNISYDYHRQSIAGVAPNAHIITDKMQSLMHRFADFAKAMITTTLPHYEQTIQWGRTSYRPAEIKGRQTSKRKDDTRVHVDSFAATPVNGLRILRVFCNINPYGEPRVWHVGEPFFDVLTKFSADIPAYNAIKAKLLKLIKATKTLRSPYDHYMLHLHDRMKLDDHYQQTLPKHRIDFPAQSSWVVFTDHVSHAALSGQFLLEQTFYLPVNGMLNAELSPLKQWENYRLGQGPVHEKIRY